MDEKLNALKEYVITLAENPSFIHHAWYVKWHLEIVEQLCNEICELYPTANKDWVKALIWIHDYAKMVDFKNQYGMDVVKKIVPIMQDIGFDDDFIEVIIESIEIFESKMTTDLHDAPIEIQIVSSADGAAHMVGPFYQIYWQEYYQKTPKELMKDNLTKLEKDWSRKIVLPEVKSMFEQRYKFLQELFGILPEKFFK